MLWLAGLDYAHAISTAILSGTLGGKQAQQGRHLKVTRSIITHSFNHMGVSVTLPQFGIPFELQPSATLVTGGQPDTPQMQAMHAAGVRQVINLRPAAEMGFDEAALCQTLGLGYANLPIAGPNDLTRENVQAFDQLLAQTGDQATVVHCASGNRVGALFALRAAWLYGADAETALSIGRAHGLTKMEALVAQLLAA